jgi:hypothetical protein
MPFEEGNQAAAKGRKIEKMIERACLQEDDKRLRQGVEVLLDKVAEGERWALEFLRDSTDGKPRQAVDVGGQQDNPINVTHGLSDALIDMLKEISAE